MINEHETEFVRQFVMKARQERYLGFLAAAKLRGKFIFELSHRLDIDYNFAMEVPNRDRFAATVERALRVRGTPDEAYIISPYRELDQRVLPLSGVLARIYDTDSEAIVSCIAGRLALYKSEDSAWILSRGGVDLPVAGGIRHEE